MKAVLLRLLAAARSKTLALWHDEPVRVSTWVTAAAVGVLGVAGNATDVAHVSPWVAVLLPIILGGGEAARGQVAPLRRPPSVDEQVVIAKSDGDDTKVKAKKAAPKPPKAGS